MIAVTVVAFVVMCAALLGVAWYRAENTVLRDDVAAERSSRRVAEQRAQQVAAALTEIWETTHDLDPHLSIDRVVDRTVLEIRARAARDLEHLR